MDSRFTYNPNFPVDSPPPCIRHPAESVWFCPLGHPITNLMNQNGIDSVQTLCNNSSLLNAALPQNITLYNYNRTLFYPYTIHITGIYFFPLALFRFYYNSSFVCFKTMPVNNFAVYSECWLYVSFDAATLCIMTSFLIVPLSRKLWDT